MALILGTAAFYWPILGMAAAYLVFLLAAFRDVEPGVVRRAYLATGAPWIIHLWGIVTVLRIHRGMSTWHGKLVPTLGFEAAICLIAILALLIPVNLLCRRIGMPTAFTLSVGASIGAVFTDFLLVLWATTFLS